MRTSNMNTLELLVAVFLCITYCNHADAYVNCTFEHRTGLVEFPAFRCPNNTHCVVSDIGGNSLGSGSQGGIFSLLPVGCCPDHLTTHCHYNGTSYSGLLGCCPPESVCCVASHSGLDYLAGCAVSAEQCCDERICEEGYKCCRSSRGSTCCPNATVCRDSDHYLPAQFTTDGIRTMRISSFFNITADQMCIPADYRGGYNTTDNTRPVGYPLIIVQFPAVDGTVNRSGFYVTGIVETPNVTVCGSQMCYADDVCIHRYRNMSKTRVYRNLTIPACANAKMMNETEWTNGCFRVDAITETTSFAAGCCAAGKTPCGAHDHTFDQHAINAHASPFLYDPIMGCAGENETCCHPFICPAGAQCCTAKRQVFGKDVDMALLRDDLGNRSFASNNEGHNFCCPAEAVCCEYIPNHVKERTVSMRSKSVPFCGTDSTCTRNFFGNNRTPLHTRAVRETIPWDDTHFNEGIAFRQSLGVVGNFNPYTTDPGVLSDTCYYTALIGTEREYFDISCGVLNQGNTTSLAGAMLAPNVAPGIQLDRESELGGIIPCPSPTPEIWCNSGA